MTTAVRNCGQLITLAGPERPRVGSEMGELGILKDAALVFDEQGYIEWVGPDAEAPRADREIDAGGRLVTPGFIDAHTHAIFGGNRANEFEMRAKGATYQEIKESGGGIMSSVRATREASFDQLLGSAQERLQWMLASGTSTLEVKSGYGLNLESEMKMLQVAGSLGPQRIVRTFLGAHAVPPESGSKGGYLESVLAMLPEVEPLAEFCDLFVESGYFEPDDARRLFASTKLKPRLHVDQFTNDGGAKLAAELGAKTADHLEQTGAEGIPALRHGGVIPVLLPASVYCLGLTKYPDARLMIEEGLPVVLATDFNPGSSPTPSLPFVMSLACTQMRMTPAEALTACTINAAYALDRGDQIGSLEVGKQADFVIHDAQDYREIAYWAGYSTVRQVFIGGKSVLSKGSGYYLPTAPN